MTKPLDSEGMGGLPTPMRPEPGRAFGRNEGDPGEPAVKVARNVYAGSAPVDNGEATRVPSAPSAPTRSAASATADRTHLLGSAEPPRSPNARPAPAPAAPNTRTSAKATLMMNDANRPPMAGGGGGSLDDRARKVQATGPAPGPAGVSAHRQPGGTLSVDEAEIRGMAASPAPPRAKPPESPTPRRGPGNTAPVPQAPVITGESEPLRLQLDAGDVLEQPVDAAPDSPGTRRSSSLVIALAVLAVAAGAAGIWYGMSGSAAPAADVPPSRNDMQPAAIAPAQPSAEPTAVPPAQAPAAAPNPTAPQAAPPAATQQPAATPGATAPTSAAPAEAEEPAAKPAAKADARAPKRKRGGRARAPSGPVSPDVAAARDALRNLEEGGPVLRVEPSEEIPAPDDGPSDSPPPPPEPPPPDPE